MFDIFIRFQEQLGLLGLMYARIVPIFMILPVLNSGVLSNMMIRNAIIAAIIIGLWPELEPDLDLASLNGFQILALACKEVMIGSAIGIILALPFWIFSAMGSYIDVARGSSMGSLMDPTSGQESTEMSNFINFCVCAIYMELGGMKLLLEALVGSYHTVGLNDFVVVNLDGILPYMGALFAQGFVLAAPVVLTLLLSEVLLGLLSRFTPQLNAFSLAMTMKSVVALFVLILYFSYMVPDQLQQMMHSAPDLKFLERVEKP